VLGKGIRFCFGVVTSVRIVDEAQAIRGKQFEAQL